MSNAWSCYRAALFVKMPFLKDALNGCATPDRLAADTVKHKQKKGA